MKNNFLLKLFTVVIFSVFIIALITLSVLGAKERVGYITDFKFIEKNPVTSDLVYSMRIRYYDKVFRGSDIYGVYVETNNLPDYITSISFEKPGGQYGKVFSEKEMSYGDRFDVGYKLKIKTFLIFCVSVFLLSIIFVFVLTNYLKKTESMLYACFKKMNMEKYLYIFYNFFPAALLFTWANLILTGLILSVFKQLNNVYLYSFIFIVFEILVVIIVKRLNIEKYNNKSIFDESIIKYKACFVFLFAVLSIIVFLNLLIVFIFPPNNWDSNTYHLPRIFFYFSQGHLGHFYTPNTRQIFFPFNATLFQMFVVEYSLPDRFFNFINFLSWIASGVTIFKISRYFKVNQFYSFTAMFLGMTGTMVLAQSTTTQNDILLAFPTLMCVYYAMKYFDTFKNQYAFLVTLSIGIACGTKPTIVYSIPVIAIFGVILIIKGLKENKVKLKKNNITNCFWRINNMYFHTSLSFNKL